MINRNILPELIELLDFFPALGIIGPRQCGKTTLVKELIKQIDKETLYLDLESHADIIKLTEPEQFFWNNSDKCIIIDEIQRMPELFPLLRSIIDAKKEAGRFILLGSASPQIMRDSSESLAGRIAYKELSPFNLIELPETTSDILNTHWFRGGYPDCFLAKKENQSELWINNFITTYVERDLPQLGLDLSPLTIRKLWMLIASDHGNLFNATNFSKALGISIYTVKKYIDFLENAFLINALPPFYFNTKKRLVKSPKLYIRDSGILHFLNHISSFSHLEGNIKIGASWEGYVIEQIKELLNPNIQMYFYRTHNGTECDLILARGEKVVAAIEIKYTSAPSITKGFTLSIQDLEPKNSFIITHSTDDYIIRDNIRICNLKTFLTNYLPIIIN